MYSATLDCFTENRKSLWEKKLVRGLLNEMPVRIGMNKLSQPCIVVDKKGGRLEQGVTGFILLDESHIAIHTYPNKGLLFLDIFSCRSINRKIVRATLKRYFTIKRMSMRYNVRG